MTFLVKSETETNVSLYKRPNQAKWFVQGYITVVESKFMCPTHSKANQIEMSEFGARKVYFMSQARRMGSSCSKDANSLMVFKEEFLKENFVNVGWGVCDFLLMVGGEITGWHVRNHNL